MGSKRAGSGAASAGARTEARLGVRTIRDALAAHNRNRGDAAARLSNLARGSPLDLGDWDDSAPAAPYPCGADAAARRRSAARLRRALSNLTRCSPLDLQPKRRPAARALLLAGGLGFEPRLTESESAVLPLDDPPGEIGSDQRFENWVARRALCRPTFLRSTSRASRVTKPALRSGWRRVSS